MSFVKAKPEEEEIIMKTVCCIQDHMESAEENEVLSLNELGKSIPNTSREPGLRQTVTDRLTRAVAHGIATTPVSNQEAQCAYIADLMIINKDKDKQGREKS